VTEDQQTWLAGRFEENRPHLRAVAYRLLGSIDEAEDAVQEAWLRLSRRDASTIENLRGWLATVVAHVCLDLLRSRRSRKEQAWDAQTAEPTGNRRKETDPEQETLLADSVGLALLVVLERLAPRERLAFVLHDMFGVSFDEIAAIIGRSPTAARQLASRARRRIQATPKVPNQNLAEQREVVTAFLRALRSGDLEGMIAVLDPEVLAQIDEAAAPPGRPREIRGARAWAEGAMAFAKFAHSIEPIVIDGSVGLVWAPNGKLRRVLTCTLAGGKIVAIKVLASPAHLRPLKLELLPAP